MEYSPNAIVESREELMISATAPENPILRTARFLKPSLSLHHKGISELSSLSLPSLPPDPKNWPLTVNFNGWRNPPRKWKEWVDKMASLHAPTWKKAGIYEAIFNSTYEFHKNSDLVLGVAEKWRPDTKSFIFPWGEATITLEDMMIAGYSVLGSPVFKPLETEESKAIEVALSRERRKIIRTSAKKALHCTWLKIFMDSGSEIEHVAFLSLWLSRFVLPTSRDVICECDFPIAIHLARGTRIALAPAVLATIYRDLSLLKEKIVALTTLGGDSENGEKLVVTTWAPFQLVLVWVWERFVKLSPKPNLIRNGEPRFAQWNNFRCNFKNVRLVLDSCGESFSWRPYTKPLENWDIPKLYREKEMWVSSDSDLDEDLLSFVLCLRVSELVGLELDCIEQYLPHRVARQFGFDQDVPGFIARSGASPEDAWSFYIRPVGDVKCFIPSRLFEAGVTRQYLDWWNSLGFDDRLNSSQAADKQEKCCKLGTTVLKQNKEGKKKAAGSLNTTKDDILISTYKTKQNSVDKGVDGDCIRPSISLKGSKSLPQTLERKNSIKALFARVDHVKRSETLADCSRIKNEQIAETNNLVVPPGFLPKCGRAEAGDHTEEDSLTIAEILKRKKQDVSDNSPCGSGKNFSCKVDHSLLAEDNIAAKNTSQEIQEEDNLTIDEILQSDKNQDVTSNRQCVGWKNLSGTPESHPSSIAAPEKRTLIPDDHRNQTHSCSAAANGFLRDLDEVAWVEPAENGVDPENFHVQSESHSSSVAGNDTPKDLELREAILAENAVVNETRGAEQGVESVSKCVSAARSLTDHEMDSISGNEKRSWNDSAEATILTLEDKIEKVEKLFAARKALLESKRLRR